MIRIGADIGGTKMAFAALDMPGAAAVTRGFQPRTTMT
jgi:hypothetical protein